VAAIYEYGQHRMTGEVWAVKLDRGRVVGAVEIYRRDVNVELLPFLTYHPQEPGISNKAARVQDDRRAKASAHATTTHAMIGPIDSGITARRSALAGRASVTSRRSRRRATASGSIGRTGRSGRPSSAPWREAAHAV